ncbi:MAG: hypothetical protein QOD86_671 [Miltoncostaeaceae bacterium]|jgi:gas vesicle protein|nr:hypothetical protein [Miltoncostaeaceae bacterium]
MRLARHRIMAGLVVVGASLAIAAGCSTDSDDPAATTGNTTAGGLTAAEYRQQANAACVDTEAGIGALDSPSSPTAEQTADILSDGLDIQQTGIDRLKALDPPDDLQANHDKAISLLEQRQTLTQQLLSRIRDGESVADLTQSLGPQIQRLRTQGDDVARDLGLDECIDGPSDADSEEETSSLNKYREDVRAAGSAIGNFARLLQNDESFSAKEDRLQANLDAFQQNIEDLSDYTLTNATLEQQRAGLARTGPNVTDVLRRFMDAAADNDQDAIQDLAPEVQQVLSEFQEVVTPGSSSNG